MSHARAYPIPTRHYPPRRPPAPRRLPGRALSVWTGAVLLAIVVAAVTVGAELLPHAPERVNPQAVLQAPSAEHLLGTDSFGRDTLSRLLHGGRASLAAGVVAVLLAVTAGTLLGVVAGYASGLPDAVISALADALLAFPGLLLALVLAWLLGSGIDKAAIAVGIAGMPVYIRIARGSVRRLRRTPYVRAAEAIGATNARILLRHILPNIVAPIVTLAVLDLGWAILHVSALSFLGVGVRPPAAEWGAMLSEARLYLRQGPWLGLAPGAAIAVTVLAANLLGEGWQESKDPVLRRRP